MGQKGPQRVRSGSVNGVLPMFRSILAVLGLALSLIFIALPAEAATPIGKVVAVQGKPSATGPGGDRALSAGSSLFEDDKIVVPGSGNAQIVLNDDTKLVVGPGSTLVLDRFVFRGNGTAQKVSLKALRGTFRFITGKSNKSAYDISTSSATIGIRGTGFDFWVKGNTGVAAMKGLVNLCTKNSNRNRAEGCVTLPDDCSIGRTQVNGASEFRNLRSAGQAIKTNLPFILNQRSLQQRFWLPTGKCDSAVIAIRRASESDPKTPRERREQRQTPPTPPSNPPPGPDSENPPDPPSNPPNTFPGPRGD